MRTVVLYFDVVFRLLMEVFTVWLCPVFWTQSINWLTMASPFSKLILYSVNIIRPLVPIIYMIAKDRRSVAC